MARTANGNGDGDEAPKGGWRLSITIDPTIRRKVRLAAAINDETVGEWCARVLEQMADKAVPVLPTRKASV